MSKSSRGMAIWLRDTTRPLRRRLAIRPQIERLGLFVDRVKGRAKRRGLKAQIIGITGSSGKSTTAILLAHLLKARGSVQAQVIRNTMPDLTRFMTKVSRETDFIVAELGMTVPGSMPPMVGHLRPNIAIMTKIGIEHYSAFRSKEAIAKEKGYLIAALPGDGLAVLNADDPLVLAMAAETRARIVTFGWSESADYCVVGARDGLPDRLRMTISCARGTFEIETPFLDSSFWLATAAAFACAVELGVEPKRAAELVGTCTPSWNRLQLLETEDGPTFVMDTVKAPAESIAPTIAVLKKARASFKTLILGSVSDYRGSPSKPYRTAYMLGREAADRVIFVGDHMHRAPATNEERQMGIFAGFHTPREVADHIRATARPGELILVKGGGSLHLERIALSWIRPVRCWEPKCGKHTDCLNCGMVEVPYSEHGETRRAAKRARLKV